MKNIGIKNIITGIFVIGAIGAFMVFSGVIKLGGDEQAAKGTVTLWGTIPYQTLQPYIELAKEQNLNIIYREKQINNYESELVNAFASGTGPDLFMMPHEGILRHSDKILEIPYESFPKTSYEETYIDEARLFLTDTGVLAFPVTVDPLIMYYNKPLIASAFLLDVPQTWDEMAAFNNAITKYNGTGEITISGVGLGTFDNIKNAKSIISSLIMQNGNPIIGTDTTTMKKKSVLTVDEPAMRQSVEALNFYTSFAQFGSNTYSWNEALVESQSKFISGELALYFGRASEITNIQRKNPNLDFGVALLPQVRDTTTKITNGAMTGVAISKQSKNIPAAINVASKIAGSVTAQGLSNDLIVAPARKDLLRIKPDDAFMTLVFNSAIISRGWLDADMESTDTTFKNLVRNINSGSLSTENALSNANAEINNMLNKTINTIIASPQQ